MPLLLCDTQELGQILVLQSSVPHTTRTGFTTYQIDPASSSKAVGPLGLSLSSLHSTEHRSMYSVALCVIVSICIRLTLLRRRHCLLYVGREKIGRTRDRTRDIPNSRRACYHYTTQPVCEGITNSNTIHLHLSGNVIHLYMNISCLVPI
jgi:hypothetical protein